MEVSMENRQFKPAEPLLLKELVTYQEGAIVSKTLYKGKGGTLTLFAFDHGQGLSEHTAPFDAFVLVLDGSAELTIGGNEVTVRQGELVLMPASVPHEVRAKERFMMLLIMMAQKTT
jgi:quercetin dioxygenase-like cupin family protein